MKLLTIVAIALLSAITICAQQKPVTVEPSFIGTAQPTTIKLPLPEYPAEAKKADLGGRVSVDITVDENGSVTINEVNGPYPICRSVTEPNVLALRLAAANAAKKAVFKPALVNQKPVSSTGWIAYTFPISRERVVATPLSGAQLATAATGTVVKEMRLDPTYTIGSGETGASAVPDNTAAPAPGLATTDRPVSKSPPKTISGGVLNGKATNLPKPIFPAAARAVHAGGPVQVQVLIDTDGNMYSAEAISGHPYFEPVPCSPLAVPDSPQPSSPVSRSKFPA